MKDLSRSAIASLSSSLAVLTDSNAVLSRELRVALRNERAFALMAIYVAILGAIVASYFPADQAIAIGLRPGSNGEGRWLFNIFVSAQAMMVVLLLPALAAGSLAQERERQTLEPLLLTPLTPAQIVWGKAVGVLLFGALLITATIPVTSLCFLLNGISPSDVIGAYAVLLGLAAFVTGFGLYCSARWHSATQAIVACYGLLPFALGLLVLFIMPGAAIGGMFVIGGLIYWVASLRSRWQAAKFAKRLGRAYNALFALGASAAALVLLAALAGSYGLGGWNMLLILFIAPYFFLVARLGLERTGEEIAKRPPPRRPTPERLNDLKAEWKRAVGPAEVFYVPSPNSGAPYTSPEPKPAPAKKPEGKATYGAKQFLPDGRNPILAKDMRAGLLGKFSYLGRFSYVIVIVSELWMLLQILVLSNNGQMENIFVAQFKGWANFHLALIMAAGAIFGARSIAPEREQQTLPQLLTTPLLPMTIVTGKLMAVLVYTFYVFVMGAPIAVLFGALGIIPATAAFGFFLLELAAGALAASWGIFCSMQGITVRRALGWALSGLAGLLFANLIIHNVILADIPTRAVLSSVDIPMTTRIVLEFDRLFLPFTAMANVLSPPPGTSISVTLTRSLVCLGSYLALAILLMVNTTAGFRRYTQNI